MQVACVLNFVSVFFEANYCFQYFFSRCVTLFELKHVLVCTLVCRNTYTQVCHCFSLYKDTLYCSVPSFVLRYTSLHKCAIVAAFSEAKQGSGRRRGDLDRPGTKTRPSQQLKGHSTQITTNIPLKRKHFTRQ